MIKTIAIQINRTISKFNKINSFDHISDVDLLNRFRKFPTGGIKKARTLALDNFEQ
ncbi:hypothetical protein TUM20400_04330 [Staphylococcus aureus]|nr:hypothetical protein TUM20400_04330 [Staphylococcus aureus]